MSKSRGWRSFAIAAAGLVMAGVALAVHDAGLFELDKNAVDDPNVPGEDWSTLYAHAQDPVNNPTQAVAVVSPMPISDAGRLSGTALLDQIFKSSSDVNPISTWNWVVADATKAGQLPPKDNITNAYAAAYVKGGAVYTYFGMDRLTANGTADIGFWFLRRPIALVPANPACSPDMLGCTGSFSGQHAIGDTLVLSAFTNGGSVDTIEVYKWVGSGGNSGGGVLQQVATGVDCLSQGANDTVCATVNSKNEIAPWPYLAGESKSVPGIFPSDHFFEGGLDLMGLGVQGCFTAFLAETRSSSSLTAQLKDFALGEFRLCGIAVEKTGDLLSKEGDTVLYHFKITNTGAMPLQMRSVMDDRLGDLSAAATAAGCATLAPKASCSFDASQVVPAGAYAGANPYVNVVTIGYVDPSDPDPATAAVYTASASHSVDLFSPAIRLTKTGDALSKVGDAVDYAITLYNDSSANAPALVCQIADPAVGLAQEATLASGQVLVVPVSGFVIPPGAADPFVNTARATCSPEGFPNVLVREASWSTDLFQPSIELSGTGDALSKIGDEVTYSLTLRNTSSADSPPLACKITSTLAGFAADVTLASGESHAATLTFAIPPGAPDPFVASATAVCSPAGFPNVLRKEMSWSTDLFQPSIALYETGATLSKIGDAVDYVITLQNTSSGDTPPMACTIVDAVLGIDRGVTLAAGASEVVSLAGFVIPAGAADPFVNTTRVACSPVGFPNVIATESGWSVNLFQPAISLGKTSTFLFSKAGDWVPYTITLSNGSSADTPPLLCTIRDAMLGIDRQATLAPGESSVVEAVHLVTAGDPDPLANTATASCSPAGFPNVLAAEASWTVDLLHPAFTVDKACNSSTPYPASGPVAFTITYANGGDADLVVASPECGPFDLPAGATHSCVHSMSGPFNTSSVTNVESAVVTMAARYGLSNSWNATASASCEVGTGKIAPTQTTCQDYVSGTASDLTQILYGAKDGLINNAAPGVFFYYSYAKAPADGLLRIDVLQQITTGNFSTLFAFQQGQLRLYNLDCTNAPGTIVSLAPADGVITVPAAAGQVFVVSAKYDSGTVVGQAVPSPTTVHYDFATLANGMPADRDADGLDLMLK